ncbi:uncharacterized protein LOC121929352 isoform X3 [Sceloporus undulatus]|uniref:uncharacterized protein LOC121929352 isoform X3 n=1 Tax=Sceloporus undulatus TaxID=8520 RepID=UPI001C4B4638|nr:uncharacterized protein LOC121929352 isoform X3 [Sceloporus undulatus]
MLRGLMAATLLLLLLGPVAGSPIILGRLLVLREGWPGRGVKYQQVSVATVKNGAYKTSVNMILDQSAQRRSIRSLKSFRKYLETTRKNGCLNGQQKNVLKCIIFYKRKLYVIKSISMHNSKMHLETIKLILAGEMKSRKMWKDIVKNGKFQVKMNCYSILNVKEELQIYVENKYIETESSLGYIALQANIVLKGEKRCVLKSQEVLENIMELKLQQTILKMKQLIETGMLQKKRYTQRNIDEVQKKFPPHKMVHSNSPGKNFFAFQRKMYRNKIGKWISVQMQPSVIHSAFPTIEIAIGVYHGEFNSAFSPGKPSLHMTKLLKHLMQTLQRVKKCFNVIQKRHRMKSLKALMETRRNQSALAAGTEAYSKEESDFVTIKQIYSSSYSEVSSEVSLDHRSLIVRSRAYVSPSLSNQSVRSFRDDLCDISSSQVSLSDEIKTDNHFSNPSKIIPKENEPVAVVPQAESLGDNQEQCTSTDQLPQLKKATDSSQLFFGEITIENQFSDLSTTKEKELLPVVPQPDSLCDNQEQYTSDDGFLQLKEATDSSQLFFGEITVENQCLNLSTTTPKEKELVPVAPQPECLCNNQEPCTSSDLVAQLKKAKDSSQLCLFGEITIENELLNLSTTTSKEKELFPVVTQPEHNLCHNQEKRTSSDDSLKKKSITKSKSETDIRFSYSRMSCASQSLTYIYRCP